MAVQIWQMLRFLITYRKKLRISLQTLQGVQAPMPNATFRSAQWKTNSPQTNMSVVLLHNVCLPVKPLRIRVRSLTSRERPRTARTHHGRVQNRSLRCSLRCKEHALKF